MAWTIKGEFVETCSCNMLCPCWYGVQELMIMDQGWCASPWLIRVEEGESNGVDISGCNLALVTYFPGPTLFAGNGTGRFRLNGLNVNSVVSFALTLTIRNRAATRGRPIT